MDGVTIAVVVVVGFAADIQSGFSKLVTYRNMNHHFHMCIDLTEREIQYNVFRYRYDRFDDFCTGPIFIC